MTKEIITKTQSNLTVGGLSIDFQRTCRVPSGIINSLPAGLGSFPLYKVADFKSGVPSDWNAESYFFPMYKSEAMWMSFSRNYKDPTALIVAAGNINAISGKPFDLTKETINGEVLRMPAGLDIKLEDQNYLVVPPQPWLDGWKAEDGKVYQFVAAEMGSGETVEGQITGEEKVGGIQFITYKPKEGLKLVPQTRPREHIIGGDYDYCIEEMLCFGGSKEALYRSAIADCSVQSMGLGKGGEIDQKIYSDPYGLDVWSQSHCGAARIYIVSSADFKQITGRAAPPTPVTYEKYQSLGMPWFELYDEKYKDTKGSSVFDKLKPVSGGPTLVEKIYEKPKVEVSSFKIFE